MDNLIVDANYMTITSTIQWIVAISLMILAGFYLINIGNRYIDRSKRININPRYIGFGVLGLCGLFLIYTVISRYPIVRTVLSATIIAAALAYIIDPFVDKLEKRGLTRAIAVLAVYVVVLVVITTLLIVVVPQLFRETRNLTMSLPIYANRWANIFNSYFGDMAPGIKSVTGIDILESFGRLTQQITTGIADLLATSISRTTIILTGVISDILKIIFMIMLVLVMTFYFLVDKKMYISKIQSLVPQSISADITELFNRINLALGEFIRGRAIMAGFVGVSTMVLLLILRIDFAIVIGIITMIADVVPYIGPALGFTPAVLFALIESPFKGFIVAASFLVIQWMENNIVAPKVIGDSMGLNPLFIFLSIVIGGGIFGVWGMVVSVPLAATSLIVIEYGIEKYKERRGKDSISEIER